MSYSTPRPPHRNDRASGSVPPRPPGARSTLTNTVPSAFTPLPRSSAQPAQRSSTFAQSLPAFPITSNRDGTPRVQLQGPNDDNQLTPVPTRTTHERVRASDSLGSGGTHAGSLGMRTMLESGRPGPRQSNLFRSGSIPVASTSTSVQPSSTNGQRTHRQSQNPTHSAGSPSPSRSRSRSRSNSPHREPPAASQRSMEPHRSNALSSGQAQRYQGQSRQQDRVDSDSVQDLLKKMESLTSLVQSLDQRDKQRQAEIARLSNENQTQAMTIQQLEGKLTEVGIGLEQQQSQEASGSGARRGGYTSDGMGEGSTDDQARKAQEKKFISRHIRQAVEVVYGTSDLLQPFPSLDAWPTLEASDGRQGERESQVARVGSDTSIEGSRCTETSSYLDVFPTDASLFANSGSSCLHRRVRQ